ncbi:ComF family protein [Sinomicrobium sp. FJxs]|uniref:ComF family protein n=1 Tax=Sinomicrobium weinanense TaxID=2842200 RepID=A0A926JQ88_9FLAO|nr:ComF family protein [Sinomicrobium weinanense]MBU3123990.1 ComF family protein [Sinomicrobium weinanense]
MFGDIYNLLFPETCPGCSACLSPNESILCTTCRHQLPVTDHHLLRGNPVEKIFYGRVKVEFASAFLPFRKKGIARQLIHHLKYKGREDIGEFLGKWYGSCLSESPLAGDVDMVIPVPLHPKKQRKRGYNQVSSFAKSIADALQVTYREDILVKTVNTSTQTFKGKLARWKENNSIFDTRQNIQLQPCHILLTDDVITTGSTLEHCVRALQKHGNVKVSIITMAVTV